MKKKNAATRPDAQSEAKAGAKLQTKTKPAPATSLRPFDKHLYYLNSVQDPRGNMVFLRTIYMDQRGHVPRDLTLREDFCGTFANSCAWVVLAPGFVAHGLDLDPEPLAYGKEKYLPALKPEQQARLSVSQGDVLTAPLAQADVVAALNFAACFFHTRKLLMQYATRVLESLKPGGLVVFDLLGGPFYEEANEHETEIEDPEEFSYFFEEGDFDPLNRLATFRIHYKRKGEPKRKDLFVYTFRLWTPPELKELLLDCGYSDVRYYWEGTGPDGDGNDVWTDSPSGEGCDTWHAYIVALK